MSCALYRRFSSTERPPKVGVARVHVDVAVEPPGERVEQGEAVLAHRHGREGHRALGRERRLPVDGDELRDRASRTGQHGDVGHGHGGRDDQHDEERCGCAEGELPGGTTGARRRRDRRDGSTGTGSDQDGATANPSAEGGAGRPAWVVSSSVVVVVILGGLMSAIVVATVSGRRPPMAGTKPATAWRRGTRAGGAGGADVTPPWAPPDFDPDVDDATSDGDGASGAADPPVAVPAGPLHGPAPGLGAAPRRNCCGTPGRHRARRGPGHRSGPRTMTDRPDPAGRRRAVALAGHTGDGPTARGALGDGRPAVRATAIGALERLGMRLRDRSRGAARRPRPGGATAGGEAGGHVPGRRCTVAPRARWATTIRRSSRSRRGPAASATRPNGRRRRAGRAHAATPTPSCREAAVAALGAIGDPPGCRRSSPPRTDKATVRRRAVLALAPFDGPEVDAALAKARTTATGRSARRPRTWLT